MSAKRVLLIGGVYQLPGRLKDVGAAMVDVCDELEPQLRQNRFVSDAAFKTVSLIFRFGPADVLNPEIGRIDTRHAELPVAIQFDLKRLKRLDREAMKNEFRTATLDVLCDVAANFDLPFQFLDAMRLHK